MILDGIAGDLAFSFRMLKRQRMYAAASIITLALGIGTTTAVFSVVDATLLRPLPYSDSNRLVGLNASMESPEGGQILFSVSQIELVRWQAATRSFQAIEGLEPRMLALTGAFDPEVLPAAAISSGLFRMLGVEPQLGRMFTADEERTDAPLAVISEPLLRRRFANAGSVLGQTIVLDGRSYNIVGVMPAGFHPLLDRSEAWVPLHAVVDPARQGLRIMASAGRLRDGATPVQAERELAGISAVLAKEFPTGQGHAKPVVRLLRDQLFGDRKPALMALAAAVLLLLVLACVNVLNLTLGHLAVRRSELAIRAVIGGSHWRLARLQLVETGLIAALGGTLGIALMNWIVGLLLALYTRPGQRRIDAHLDWRVAMFGAILTIGAAIVTGVIPALRAHRGSLDGGLARVSSGRVRGGVWERRIRAGLVVAQIALAVTLLCGAGAFNASLQRLLATSPGFSTQRVYSAQLMLSPIRYRVPVARARFVQQMLDKVSAIPGVAAAGTTQTTFLPNESMQTLAWIEGRPVDPEHMVSAHIRHITPGYFASLRVPIVTGRAIDDRDRMGAPLVCMVSTRFAKRFWPNESAIGHRIRRTGATAQWMTIVGVTADVMDNGLGVQPEPTLYVAYLQQNTPTARVSLAVRTVNDSPSFAHEIQRAVWAVDPEQPVDRLSPLTGVLNESTGDQRFRTILLAAFAVLGLALALIGVYGVTAAAIAARTWEVGVRMALGATPASVVSKMLLESGRLVLFGAAAGVVLFLSLGRFAASLLYNTAFGEPLAMSIAIVPLLLTALTVSYLQARRLAAVSPVSALRNDV